MPRTINEGFTDFLKKLTPSVRETEAAKSHRASISGRLERDFGLDRFVRIGSFGNGTSISGHSDVDYLASLRRDTLTASSTYSLAKIRLALAERFPNTNVRVSCPAIAIPFGAYVSETTEIVPADYIKQANGFPVYDIPDCSGGWMEASPDAHNAYVAEIDASHGGKVKPLIRFVKAWKYSRQVPISSFYLELRVAKYASQEKLIVYDIDVKQILCSLRDNGLASMRDPMGISGYISPCKTETQLQDALSKLKRAATRAENAREAAERDDTAAAFAWWRLLYNDEFPTYYY